MITACELAYLTTIDSKELSRIFDTSGYSMCSFKDTRFVGINQDGAFCYNVTYFDEDGTGETNDNVYVILDPLSGVITAEF